MDKPKEFTNHNLRNTPENPQKTEEAQIVDEEKNLGPNVSKKTT